MRRHFALLVALCAIAFAAEARVTSYVFVRGREHLTSNVDLGRAMRLREGIGGTFLWFRADGQSYVVRDPGTLADIDRLFEPVRALQPKYESLRQKRQPFDDREEQLDREIDRLEERVDELSEDDETASHHDDLRRLEEQIRGLEREMREVEQRLRGFDALERQLDREEEALEREAERAMEPILDGAVRRGVAKPF